MSSVAVSFQMQGKIRQNVVELMGHAVLVNDPDHCRNLATLLRDIATEAQRRAPPLPESQQSGTLPLVDLLQQGFGAHDDLFLAPSIPESKEANARGVHNLDASEPILALYDGTVFGSAEEGFIATPQRFRWKALGGYPKSVAWSELRPGDIKMGGSLLSTVSLKGEELELKVDADRLFQFLGAVTDAVNGAG